MKFNYIHLKGFRRLSLNSIESIYITFENLIILILGTNGSGKSSLLSQLTPLPGSPSDYKKDGFKIVELTHKGSTYLLKNIFSTSGNKYHFIKDGEEVNPGGVTITVFKELVKREFGLTQDIHNLMTGQSNFHSLTVNERRNWFTRISDADYTYAISYYNRLREQHRDIQGGIKLLQSRLVQESEKLLKPEREQELKNEIEGLRGLLARMLDSKKPLTCTKNEALTIIEQNDVHLFNQAKRLVASRSEFLNLERYTGIEDIDHDTIDVQSSIQTCERSISKIFEEIDKRQKTIDTLKNSNIESFKDIDKQIDNLSLVIHQKQTKVQTLDRPNPSAVIPVIDSIQTDVSDLCISLAEFVTFGFNFDSLKTLLQQKETIELPIRSIDGEIQRLQARKKEMDHLREHGLTECPECKHRWIRGFTQSEYDVVTQTLPKLEESLNQAKLKKTEYEKLLESCTNHYNILKSFSNIVRGSPALSGFWSMVQSNQYVLKQPMAVITALADYRDDMLRLQEIEKLNIELKNTVDLKQLAITNQETSLNTLVQEIEQLNLNMFRENENLSYLKRKLSKLKLYRKVALSTSEESTAIEKVLAVRDKQVSELMDSVRSEYVNECIHLVKLELNTREQLLSKVDIQKALVADIDKQIKELTDKEELLKIAVKKLSPTEGLIAKGMTGFINHFVKQMNSFIKKIWLYPLELVPIVPCEEDGIDLDYKFSVKINDDIEIADVAIASSAMKEVIDLAFRVVSMPYLGLSEAPLYLDEFSRAFDSEHRRNAFYAITNLMTSSNFTQIFLISHYENTYGSLKNSDVIVLCPANVGLPKDLAYNKTVQIS